MTDKELLKCTLLRHNLTQKQAAAAWGVSFNTLASAISGRAPVPEKFFRSILEYETRLYCREQDFKEIAARLNQLTSVPAEEAPTADNRGNICGRRIRRKKLS